MPEMIEIAHLHDHPHNPRLDRVKGKETIERLARLIKERGFDEAHALIVRPHHGAYQIVSGHRRRRAAKRAGLTEVPCWVREMTDAEAHMLLLNENIQDGLHPIEEGRHALDSHMSQRDYAAQLGVSRSTLKPKIEAARVYASIKVPLSEVGRRWRALAVLHSAKPWLWPWWAPRLLAEGWTIEETERKVARAGHVQQPPAWVDAKALADGLLNGTTRPEDLHEMDRLLGSIKDRTTRETVAQALAAVRPASLAIAKQVVETQTPPPLATDDGETIAVNSEPLEPLWPDEFSIDEPPLEQQYQASHARRLERLAEKRFRQLLKVRIQPRWKFAGVPPAEREHLRDQIDELIGWLKAARAGIASLVEDLAPWRRRAATKPMPEWR
jgi:ParB family chromosome partitioning protein